MKHILITSLKQLLDHRRLLTVLVILLLLTIGVIVYVSITIEASDLRVITHYTAYGITHFYRDTWVYLLSFIAFVVLSAGFGIGLCVKLLLQEREELALLFGWISVVIVTLALVTYIHVVGLM